MVDTTPERSRPAHDDDLWVPREPSCYAEATKLFAGRGSPASSGPSVSAGCLAVECRWSRFLGGSRELISLMLKLVMPKYELEAKDQVLVDSKKTWTLRLVGT